MSTEARPPRVADDHPPTTGSPAERARRILHLYLEQQIAMLPPLIHPEAQLEAGFGAPGATFDSKSVLDAAWVAASTGAYRPTYELVESLDEDTALVGVRIRYEIGEGLFSDREAAYLMVFRDGLLWSNRVFDSIEEAIESHRTQRRA